MPVAIGVDLVEVERLTRLLKEQPEIAPTIFTPRELEYCGLAASAMPRLAARFAAKEAVLKALGAGLSQGVEMVDVEIIRSTRGRPSVRLSGRAREIAERQGIASVEISMSHSGGLALAHALSLRSSGTARARLR